MKRAEETASCVCSTMLAVAVTARELVNVSRSTTMNEGMVGALSCIDTAAGIHANGSLLVERKKWRVLRCAHAKQMAFIVEWRVCTNGVSMASFGCGAFGSTFASPSRRRLPSQQCYH